LRTSDAGLRTSGSFDLRVGAGRHCDDRDWGNRRVGQSSATRSPLLLLIPRAWWRRTGCGLRNCRACV